MLRTSILLCTCLLLACDRDVPETPAGASEVEGRSAPDNTAINQRDRNEESKTPLDQGNSNKDLQVTQQIRQAIVDHEGLSFTARNVKVITEDGRVTLRGPVESAAERSAIAHIATNVVGTGRVENFLEVATNN